VEVGVKMWKGDSPSWAVRVLLQDDKVKSNLGQIPELMWFIYNSSFLLEQIAGFTGKFSPPFLEVAFNRMAGKVQIAYSIYRLKWPQATGACMRLLPYAFCFPINLSFCKAALFLSRKIWKQETSHLHVP